MLERYPGTAMIYLLVLKWIVMPGEEILIRYLICSVHIKMLGSQTCLPMLHIAST